MIYRVVIIDNGNQVSLTKKDGGQAVFEVDGDIEPSEFVRGQLIRALSELTEVEEIDTDDN